ncbi:MAG: SRPBCC domain-containing protein [Brevundimonas sp.]
MLSSPDVVSSAWANWPLDREIVLTRVIDAPVSLVWAAWTDPDQIPVWFGPAGLEIETREIDLRPGGVWRFDMVGPQMRFSNRMTFLHMEPGVCIEVEQGADVDDDPDRFRMLVTFDEQDDGKTVLTLRQMHRDRERRRATIGFGAVEYGAQTLDKLERHLLARRAGV